MYLSDQLLVNLDHFRGIIPMQLLSAGLATSKKRKKDIHKMIRSMDYLEVDEISAMCLVIILDMPEGHNTSSDTGIEGELPNLYLGQ